MRLNINLPDEQIAALIAKAQAKGLSAEEYAQQVLAHELEETVSEPFWKNFTRQMRSLPDEVFDTLPTDGASEHDHYLYGSPRQNS